MGTVVNDIVIDRSHSERFTNIIESGNPYEPGLHSELESSLGDDDVFFDVGARFGYFSMVAERSGSEVCAFERDSRFLQYLNENISGMVVIGRVGEDVSLDDFSGKNPSTVLIDVEGDEVDVLRSATGIISDSRPEIFIEMHPWELGGSDYGEIEDMLSDYSLSWTNHREKDKWKPGIGYESESPTYMIRAV